VETAEIIVTLDIEFMIETGDQNCDPEESFKQWELRFLKGAQQDLVQIPDHLDIIN
jgi:hypothetical protein